MTRHASLLMLLPVLLLAACGPSPEQVEATVQAGIHMTETAKPTATPIPTATRTPRPSPTPNPTPAPVGVAVPYGSLEITLLSAFERDTMHMADIEGRHYIYYTAPEGGMIVDLAALVHNTNSGGAVSVKWQDIFILQENGIGFHPIWAKVKTMDEASLADPYSIGISSEDVDPDASVDFVDYTYLRLVYLIQDQPNQKLVFRIEGSPRIGFQTVKGP